MSFDPDLPFNTLPPLPPRESVESVKVLKKALNASRALAELKGLGGIIPNQAMLIHSLILQEAKASSEIENIFTTNDALFKAMAAPSSKIDAETKEVLRYREALWAGFTQIRSEREFSIDLFVELAKTITGDGRGIRTDGGTVIGNRMTGTVVYTPPVGEQTLRKMLKELIRFLHGETDLDPLVKLALSHYQFEAIHPFYDGNGRTGRMVNILYLVHAGLLELPVLYLSKYIIERKPEYYRCLREVTESADWEPWILFLLEGVEQTAIFSRDRILGIRALLEETLERARDVLPSRVYSKDLIELIFRHPYTKGQFIVDAGIAERQTAAEYLKELESTGFLRAEKVGRENLYLNVKLYDYLSR